MSRFERSRRQRRHKLGVDSVDRIVWRQWEPGNEYVRTIRIRNVDVRMQTIQYKLPLRKMLFLVGFPEPVALGSGMSFDLEVRFRPTELVETHDVIEVTVVGRGSYIVHLESQLPSAKLQLPPTHDFSYVAAGTTASHTLKMENVGSVVVTFEWDVPPPFFITPVSGVLRTGEVVELCLHFAPSDACVLVAQAVCKVVGSGEVLASMKLSGIGKYPFLRVAGGAMCCNKANNTMQLDFGHVLTGTTQCMEFCIENPSMVNATFALEEVTADGSLPCPFTIMPRSGVIARGATHNFKVSFTPTTSGMVSVKEFQVVVLAGNSVPMRLRGVATAPSVHLSTRTIDFGDVQLDDGEVMPLYRQPNSRRRFFNIKNNSNVATEFHTLLTSPGAVFVVTPVTGALPAKSSVRIQVEFCPTHPINYLRRLLILVKNMESFLYIDVFGSAYNHVLRPLPFGMEEVEAFFLRHDCGLAGGEPGDLAVITNGLRNYRPYSELIEQLPLSEDAALGLQRLMEYYSSNKRKNRGKAVVSFSCLSSPFSTGAAFCLSNDTLVFPYGESEEKLITVYNRSSSAARACWCVPIGCAFTVTPMQGDVPPCSSCSFVVSVASIASAPLADQFLECYVNYSVMQSFLLVEEGAFTPPHFFTLRCQRHLKPPVGAEGGAVSPVIKATKSLIFPACRPGDVVHTVLYVENYGDVAVMFTIQARMESFDPHGVAHETASNLQFLSCNPSSGLIPSRQRLPVILSFSPQWPALFHGEARIILNDSQQDEIRVTLHGESFTPQLVIERGNMIFLRPTCVTGDTRHQLSILNPTCIPILFEVFPSSGLCGVVQCDASSGLLDPGQRAELTLIFTPTEAVVYEGHLNFLVTDGSTLHTASATYDRVRCIPPEEENLGIREDVRACTISCSCMGEGRYAVVEVEPVTMEHEGPAMQKKTFEWTIYNSSLCEVSYEVRWVSITDPTHWKDDEAPPVQLSHNKCGKLAARSHTVVLVTLQPRAGFSEYILYTLVGGSEVSLHTIPDPTSLQEVQQHAHCEVRLRGTRPAVQITDVRSLQQHKSQLWCQLSINTVNEVLAAPVQAIDVEKDSFAFPKYIQGLEPIFMDIGVGCVHHMKKEVLLRVENAGQCPASFRFWYPTEHEGGDETWFIEDEELEAVRQMLSDRLLEISPREGTIPVGSHKIITIVYRHSIVGAHCLPVLLRLSEGKKALLVLEGRTVPPDANTLAFHHSAIYNLHPVALGDMEPPLQTTTIENTATRAVDYVVQDELTQLVDGGNYGFPVFQCLNPTGVIPAGGTAQLNWYFRPLEARSYSIEVVLHVIHGEEYSLQFVGVGYHPKKMLPEVTCALINEAFLSIPVSPSLRLPTESCPVSLSMDVMRVGTTPCFSLHRRVCYIENTHARHTYAFFWSTELSPGSSTVVVTPPSGMVGPGQRVRCHLVLQCGSLSQILETPVFCRIHNESVSRTTGQAQWLVGQAVMKGGQNESTEVVEEEEGPFDDPLLDSKPPPKRPFERSTCTKLWPLGTSKKRIPVTAIPPEYQSVRVLAASVGVAAPCASSASQQPCHELEGPVVEHSLEVLVQARIMPIGEYERLFGKRALQQTYFPIIFQNNVDPPSLPVSRNEGPTMYSAEPAKGAVQVLERLLRTIIAQPHVRQAFTEPINAKIPYYRDLVPASVTTSAPKQSRSLGSASLKGETEMEPLLSQDTPATAPPVPSLVAQPQGAMLNLVEGLFADMTIQAVDAAMRELRVSP